MQCEYIDAYSHFCPLPFLEYMNARAKKQFGHDHVFKALFTNTPTLIDIDERLKQMQRHAIEKSVFVPLPWLESVPALHKDPKQSFEAADLCNRLMAEIKRGYTRKFYCTGLLPTIERGNLFKAYDDIVGKYQLDGLTLFVGPDQKPLDHPDYLALFELAARDNIPTWVHPCRSPLIPDYLGEERSKHMIWQALGWVYDSSCAMIRLAMTGIFERLPDLKIVTHHHGAMIPLFAERMDYSLEFFEHKGGQPKQKTLSRPLSEHLKMFYCDTATHAYKNLAIREAVEFFGEDRVLFGTDAPMDVTSGTSFIDNAQRSLRDSNLSTSIQNRVARGNLLKLLQ